MCHNLSTSFKRFHQGIASCISWSSVQTQQQVNMDVDSNSMSPNTMHVQISTYQQTVRGLHKQNNHRSNSELLGRLEQTISDRAQEISQLRM